MALIYKAKNGIDVTLNTQSATLESPRFEISIRCGSRDLMNCYKNNFVRKLEECIVKSEKLAGYGKKIEIPFVAPKDERQIALVLDIPSGSTVSDEKWEAMSDKVWGFMHVAHEHAIKIADRLLERGQKRLVESKRAVG